MSARLLAEANGAAVYLSRWQDLVPVVAAAGGCDAIITDTPYSAKVHNGHDSQVQHLIEAGKGDVMRNGLNYGFWTPEDVREFVEAWNPLCRGWMVSITDHVLARAWEAEMERVGRYVFPWLPYVAPGSRVRLAGDGPSCWTTQIVVSRPRTKAMASWGTLDGAYFPAEADLIESGDLNADGKYAGSFVLPPGEGGALPVVGGKPRWLMERLVEDYSRPGDLVVDPCCGAGTTAAAAIRTGRRAIVGDAMQAHAEMAARWIRDPAPKCPTVIEARQGVLFGGG